MHSWAALLVSWASWASVGEGQQWASRALMEEALDLVFGWDGRTLVGPHHCRHHPAPVDPPRLLSCPVSC